MTIATAALTTAASSAGDGCCSVPAQPPIHPAAAALEMLTASYYDLSNAH